MLGGVLLCFFFDQGEKKMNLGVQRYSNKNKIKTSVFKTLDCIFH
jgi:hypothetical protein